MRAEERRKEIVNFMLSAKRPVPGKELSEIYCVSRQIIVSDISILKAMGYEIFSTHKGYIINRTPLYERVFKVYHTREETENELSVIVNLGGTVSDVFVRHKVYGRIEAPLNIFSLLGVKQFIEGVRTGKSTELMNITGGYHYHTVRADSNDTLDKIEDALKRYGYLI